MSDGIDDLYREIILDHYKHPRNHADLSHVGDEAVHENPSCGDSLKLEVSVDSDGTVVSVRFDGHGCAISVSSASMMTELVKGKSVEVARETIATFLSALRGETPKETLDDLGEIAALGGVVNFPLRVKCATLAWHALDKSL